MHSYLAPLVEEPAARRTQAENMVRTLQSSAAATVSCSKGFCLRSKPSKRFWPSSNRARKVNGLFTDTIDLFADNAQESASTFQTKDKARGA